MAAVEGMVPEKLLDCHDPKFWKLTDVPSAAVASLVSPSTIRELVFVPGKLTRRMVDDDIGTRCVNGVESVSQNALMYDPSVSAMQWLLLLPPSCTVIGATVANLVASFSPDSIMSATGWPGLLKSFTLLRS